MEQIFYFQFSKEVYVRPSTVQANKENDFNFYVRVRAYEKHVSMLATQTTVVISDLIY
jgi:hypothetical protein